MPSNRALDCFAEPVIGPRIARTRWLAMTMERLPPVIACDKREAFAQGSGSDEAIQSLFVQLDCFANARNDDEPRHCEERQRRSNPEPFCSTGLLRFARNDDGAAWIASLALAMTMNR
jgi:hypothetical protein